MLMQCPKSCGLCAAVASPRFRERSACTGLARGGSCGDEKHKSFMFHDCPISCQVVDEPCREEGKGPKWDGRPIVPQAQRGHDET